MDDKGKMELIEKHFRSILKILGLDTLDSNLEGTPRRVARMYVQEVFGGINPRNKPEVTLFDNTYNYDQMIVVRDITFHSFCEHHFVPFFGKVHIGYFSTGKIIGLSKANRLVKYYAARPQTQERLTIQIAREMGGALCTQDVGVVVSGTHLCVAARGVNDTSSRTVTSHFLGKFREEISKSEFLNYIHTQEKG